VARGNKLLNIGGITLARGNKLWNIGGITLARGKNYGLLVE
jgi:hypothetical protein